jgi:hypothetical protein
LPFLSGTAGVIITVCVLVGIIVIVIASYFCCCHAACRAAGARSAVDADAENGREGWQRQDAGVPVPTPRPSMDKRDEKTHTASSTTDAPPRYEEI